ncbi:MAG TPA: sugar ABC transporter ATP-binding protein [Pseudolysinimonas sp.]|jgi:simple sugar transport system ATP-binding protein|nr:sugar ABC transporter ATP-binding protein [Pseudolysinimonas sp.]
MTDAQTGSGVPLLQTRNLVKSYGATRALDDVSLSVQSGESLALVGRNGAGKSTLVRMLTGLDQPDSGEILFNGEHAPDPASREAWRAIVACVYQHSTVIPDLTVGENLFINDQPRTRAGFVRWPELRRASREVLDSWGLGVDADARAGDLPVGQRQLLEIARALRRGSRFIILDEPTAQLELREIEQLFDNMRRLRGEGVTFIFISHHLDEVYEVCGRAAVMRDGRLVAHDDVARLPKDKLVTAMVGQDAAAREARAAASPATATGPVALDVTDLTVRGRVDAVSLQIHAGEKLGLAGLTGSGRVELAKAIVGELRPDSGSVRIGDTTVRPGSVRHARDSGLGYVPGDRHESGFCANLSVEENISLTVLERIGRAGFVSGRRRRRLADHLIEDLEIKVSSPAQLAQELSGGNQQKTVMGRALAIEPSVLVLVSPTAGVDIASKEALFDTIRDADAAVLLVSDEIDELALCDRVLVMFDGRIHEEFARDWEERDMVAAIEGMKS